MNQHSFKNYLLATTVICGAAVAAVPAYAQDQAQTAPVTTVSAADVEDAEEDEAIVVTGSLFRRTNTETPSPVTTVSAESMSERGINTIADAVQRVAANGAGTITQGWNVGFNFATGANAASLRGLTVQRTLTIFDGLRMAPYPLADDGVRNFVDLNTIPQGIIDRVEILRDGASSTYGADAVAGVINVITKDEIQGIHINGSAGISQRGDAAEQRIDATVGYGDLGDRGFNAYINAEYQRNEPLWARDRDYPFNTGDLSRICNDAGTSCMPNLIFNGISPNGLFNGLFATHNSVVRPINANGTAGGRYNLLNTAAGCRDLTPVTVTPAQSATAGPLQCQYDNVFRDRQLQPAQERLGVSGRVTVNVGDRAQVYAMANFYRVDTHTTGTPLNFHGTTPPPGGVAYNPVLLPVYVCAAGVGSLTAANGCNATNGVLNPNNPFAAQGQRAQVLFRYDRGTLLDTRARALRGAIGINGSFGDNWNYSADFTASNVQLETLQSNYLIPQRIMDVVADGTWNFVNPDMNGQDIRDYIAPRNETTSNSNLWQATATLSKELFELPGGPLQAAVGLAYRQESIDTPSANPQNDAHPFDRYYTVNAVGAQGGRNVKSAYFEVNAPIVDQLEINLSGRYDKYSSGQKNFSPKIGAKFTPIQQLAIRGTYSKGFRIPSFNEAFGLPTTGYVTTTLNPANPAHAAFIAAHGGNAYATQLFAYGLTGTGNPALDPEKSTSFTLGAIFEPIPRVSLTVDYWNVKVRDVIGGADYSGVLPAYYGNNGVVNIPGINVIPAPIDPDFPNALPHIGFIEYSFQNAGELRASGIDFGATARIPFGGVRLTSSIEASYLLRNEQQRADGTLVRYDGSLSPCDVTSCSGSPKWRANWQNTLAIGDATVSATAYYTGGYDLASTDYGGVPGDCEASIGISVVTYQDGTPVLCRARRTWNVDMSASYKVDDHFTIYANVLNVFDIDAPFEPSAAYHLFQFNPAWAGSNIMGRYFRLGAKVDF